MYIGNPWGLIGLVAVPVILYIHLFRQRFPPKEIAGLFLWIAPRLETRSGERRERLPITLSLILELLAALLLTFLLSDVRVHARHGLRHFVFVLDNSASMSAKEEDGASAADRAVAFVKEQLSSARQRRRATVILTGHRPVILGRTAAEAPETIEALAAYRPSLPAHSPTEAQALAMDIAGDTGEVFFLSDHLPAEEARRKQITYVALGKPLPNVGLVGAEWQHFQVGGKSEIFLRVANFSSQQRPVKLIGRVADQVILERCLSLPPRAQEKVVLAPPANAQAITFEIPPDPLSLDNRATLIRPSRKVVGVANWFPEGPVRAQIERALASLDNVSLVSRKSRAHVKIVPPNAYAPTNDGSWWLVIGPLGGRHRGEGKPKNFVGPFLIESAHPLMEGVTLQGLVWPGAVPSAGGVAPIVSGGEIPLIGLVPAAPARTYWLNLDVAHSNLTRSPDWPILLSNLMELRRALLPGLQRRSFCVGGEIRFRSPDPEASLLLTGPNDYEKELPAAADVAIPRLGIPGVYEIKLAGQAIDRFSLNLVDDKESDLSKLAPGKVEGQPPQRAVALSTGEQPPWVGFLVGTLILAAVLWNWWLNYRRTEVD